MTFNGGKAVANGCGRTDDGLTDDALTDDALTGTGSRRVILILGAPRSGTTWLAKILDTYPGVLYLHEPLRKLRHAPVTETIQRIRGSQGVDDKARADLLAQFAQMHHECIRPPFFKKSFHRLPPWLIRPIWVGSGYTSVGQNLFRRLLTPGPQQKFDLLIKEVDWKSECTSIIDALRPDRLIFIIRHPCGAVCSRVTGLQLGVIPDNARASWVERHEERFKALGYSADQVMKMSPYAYYALDWVLQNLEYQRIAQSRPGCRTVIHKNMCDDPLAGAADLFAWLGWQQTPATEKFIRSSGRSLWKRKMFGWISNRRWYYDLHRDPEESASEWRTLLTPEQVNEILSVTRAFPWMHWWSEEAAQPEENSEPQSQAVTVQAETVQAETVQAETVPDIAAAYGSNKS